MERSFLNLITTDGRMCRLAELGYHAESPSFSRDGIIFRAADTYKHFCLNTGRITDTAPPDASSERTSPDGRYTLSLEITSDTADGRGYVHMMLCDNTDGAQTVLTRFMGCADSIGNRPFSEDSKQIVFFGYPAEEFG